MDAPRGARPRGRARRDLGGERAGARRRRRRRARAVPVARGRLPRPDRRGRGRGVARDRARGRRARAGRLRRARARRDPARRPSRALRAREGQPGVPERDRPGRPRRRARGRRRLRRRDLHDARVPQQPDGAARDRRGLGARRADALRLDPGRLGRRAHDRQAVRARARPGARDLPARRRRLRLQGPAAPERRAGGDRGQGRRARGQGRHHAPADVRLHGLPHADDPAAAARRRRRTGACRRSRTRRPSRPRG